MQKQSHVKKNIMVGLSNQWMTELLNLWTFEINAWIYLCITTKQLLELHLNLFFLKFL